jgi:hypothetical protein
VTEVLAVSIDHAEGALLRRSVVTLPASYRLRDDDRGIVGLRGTEGWVVRAQDAVDDGARGVLVTDPSEADVVGLRDAAIAGGAAVVLDRGWASSRSVARAAAEFARILDPMALVESRIDAPTGSDPTDVLLRHLALIRASVGAVTSMQIQRLNRSGYDLQGESAGGATLSLAGVFSDALPERALVRTVRQDVTVLLDMGSPDLARPATLRILRNDSEETPLLPYETPQREAWRRLHRLAGAQHVDELDAFVQDIAIIRDALAVNGGRR